jgi:glycosyltransferase involved in cell wall biosynthesis
MLRVVHLDTGQQLRGGQRQLLMLAGGLRQRGHEQLVVCPEGSALETRAGREGLRVFALPPHDPGQANGIMQLRQQLLAEPAQILHAHDGRGQTLAWLASLGLAVRRVASRRVTFLPDNRARHRFIYRHTCHAVIAVSEYIRQLLVSSGIPRARIEVIPDGIEIPPELPSAERRLQVRAQWGMGEHEFVMGHVGAFAPEKGQDIALRAVLLLADRLPQARLLLVGELPPSSAARIEEEVRAMQARVRLLGDVEDLADFFAALDLFLMPSRAEGLGSSALRAMAHGRAVVASRVGGLPEVVQEGKTGWLVPAESPHDLADAILAAASDRARLTEFGISARERARQFSSDIMVARTEALYRRLLAHA